MHMDPFKSQIPARGRITSHVSTSHTSISRPSASYPIDVYLHTDLSGFNCNLRGCGRRWFRPVCRLTESLCDVCGCLLSFFVAVDSSTKTYSARKQPYQRSLTVHAGFSRNVCQINMFTATKWCLRGGCL